MHRPASIVAPQRLRKPVSLTPAAAAEKSSIAHGPAVARVRDGLVLRVVTKSKPRSKRQPNEHDAR